MHFGQHCAIYVLIIIALWATICRALPEIAADPLTPQINLYHRWPPLSSRPTPRAEPASRRLGICLVAMSLPLLMLLSCLCWLCCSCSCSCRRSSQLPPDSGLDAYAPRTQSIVWPPLPEDSARVLELTFLHTPDSRDCLCRVCIAARILPGTGNGHDPDFSEC